MYKTMHYTNALFAYANYSHFKTFKPYGMLSSLFSAYNVLHIHTSRKDPRQRQTTFFAKLHILEIPKYHIIYVYSVTYVLFSLKGFKENFPELSLWTAEYFRWGDMFCSPNTLSALIYPWHISAKGISGANDHYITIILHINICP